MSIRMPLLCVVVLCVSAGGCRNHDWPVVHDGAAGNVIVAFGDSITAGEGAVPSETYPAHLAELLGKPVENLGRSGDTTADGRSRLQQVIGHGPDTVIITLGGNDILQRVPRDETLRNLRTIFQELHSAGAMVVYAAVDPPLIGGDWSEQVRELCREEGVLYVPGVMDGLWTDTAKMSDQIHPNGAGYLVIAERIHARLADHLAAP